MMTKKLLRITTSSISLDLLLKGQLAFLNQYYEVVGVASVEDHQAGTGLIKDTFTFCFVGRLAEDKGINELAGAFIQLHEIHSGVHLILAEPLVNCSPWYLIQLHAEKIK